MKKTAFLSVILAVAAGLCFADHVAQSLTKVLTESEILRLLPIGAKLADDIPLVPETRIGLRAKEKQDCIYYADTDGDGRDEIIVAYYYSAPPKKKPTTEGEKAWVEERAYYCKSHVQVLDWDGKKYVKQWDSGGFGERFLATTEPSHGKPVSEKDRPYAANAFCVRDITGDGRPEILWTVPYRRTANFRAFSWDGTTYNEIASVSWYVRLEDTDDDGKQEVIIDRGRHAKPLDPPVVFKWDGESYKTEEKEWHDRVQGQ